ncbi:hypothetical protein HDU82_002120 [Entophlyctis luteolus]|nr:hypothetical protein HDU82_002120 [Entophlyctis luteolus]
MASNNSNSSRGFSQNPRPNAVTRAPSLPAFRFMSQSHLHPQQNFLQHRTPDNKISFNVPATHDMHRTPGTPSSAPAWTTRSSSSSTADESDKRAQRAKRFGISGDSPTMSLSSRRPLFKPTDSFNFQTSESDANQLDFISFGDMGDPFSEHSQPTNEFVFNDKDPLELVYDLPQPVWCDPGKQYSSNLTEMFNEEVQDYVKYIAPTAAEHSVRQLTIERLRFVVKKIWPDATVAVFGSFSTQLYLPTSDVDIVIMGKNLRAPNSLFELSVALRDHGYTSKIEVIAKAKVPIIKYTDALTDFPVDVSINMEGGSKAAEIVKTFLNEPNGVGDAIRGLMYLLKQFLLARHLNEPFSGGCGSYALLILVTSFVKVMHPMIQCGAINPFAHIGLLFLEFLETYGHKFNFPDIGISCDPKTGPMYFVKRSHHFSRAPGYLTLLDPQDVHNDVGSGAFNFHMVRTEFARAYTRVVVILGSALARDEEDDRRHRRRHHPPLTILSAVLTVRKGLYGFRMAVEELWQKVLDGVVMTGVDEVVWAQVCEALKNQQETSNIHLKRKWEEINVAKEVAMQKISDVTTLWEPVDAARKTNTKVVGKVIEDVNDDGAKREWKKWEQDYLALLKEGSGSDSDMDVGNSSLEEGETEDDTKGNASKTPLKKRQRI